MLEEQHDCHGSAAAGTTRSPEAGEIAFQEAERRPATTQHAPNLVEAVSRTRIPEVLGAVQVFIKSTMDCSEIGLPVRRHVIEPISP